MNLDEWENWWEAKKKNSVISPGNDYYLENKWLLCLQGASPLYTPPAVILWPILNWKDTFLMSIENHTGRCLVDAKEVEIGRLFLDN